MSLDHANKLLQTNELIIDLKRDKALRELFKEDEEKVLSQYKLTEGEREAIKARNFKALYDIGIHQYLVAQFSRMIYGTANGSNDGGGVKILMDQMLSGVENKG